MLASNPAFLEFYELSGTREEKIRGRVAPLQDVEAALAYMHEIFPNGLGAVCFIDRGGAQNAWISNREPMPPEALMADTSDTSFFAGSTALEPGGVYQSRPYRSRDIDARVVSTSAPVSGASGELLAFVHFEATLESLLPSDGASDQHWLVVDRSTGELVMESGLQEDGSSGEDGLSEALKAGVAASSSETGRLVVDDRRLAWAQVPSVAGNQNDWVLAVAAPDAVGTWGIAFGPGQAFGLLGAFVALALGSVAMRTYRRDLERLASIDQLTELPNRAAVEAEIREAARSASRGETLAAVALLDLDRFKELNDTLGHNNGDAALVEIAVRLNQCAGESAFIGRLGGDEFVLVLHRVSGREEALSIGERLLECVRPEIAFGEFRVDLDGSVGIALVSADLSDVSEILRRADAAMYQAKRDKLGCAVYDERVDDFDPERLALVPALKEAIAADDLYLEFQPKVCLQSRCAYGVEALARWRHPVHGNVPPATFIRIAEETGLIRELTASVIDQALAQCRSWLDQGIDIPVAVNLSARNLLDPDLVGMIAERLERFDVPSDLLELEVTETMLEGDTSRAERTVRELRELGLAVALDDFGVGHASLSRLQQLPVDQLKIDRSFVSSLTTSETDASIVRSAINLAKDLQIPVVAEGVEDEQTLAQLAAMSCDLVQGFGVRRPMAEAELLPWLLEHAPPDGACTMRRRARREREQARMASSRR